MIICQCCFSQEVKQIWNNICVISLKACTAKTKTLKFNSEITYFFQLSVFSNLRATSNPYKIELFRLEFLV